MKSLRDLIIDTEKKGSKEDSDSLNWDQLFLSNLRDELGRASKNILDVVSLTAMRIAERYNSFCAVGLCYDEDFEERPFAHFDHHGMVPEEFSKKVRDKMVESYLDGRIQKRPLGDNYDLSILALPIINSGHCEDSIDIPDYVVDGKYGSIILSREEPFGDVDKIILNEATDNIVRAVRDNQRFGYDVFGAYNKQKLKQDLEKEIEKSKKYPGYTFSLAIFDIDHFDRINNELGHPQGDEVLREFTNLVKGYLGIRDTCFRYGGDEFVTLLPSKKEKEARRFAEIVRERVYDHDFTKISDNGGIPRISISGGVKEYKGEKDIINSADLRLYEAKKDGRNMIYPKLEDLKE